MALLQLIGTLAALALLEAVLAGDNAVALAAIVRDLPSAEQQRWALDRGLLLAFVLRAGAIALATSVIHNPLVQVLAGAYLIVLAVGHFQRQFQPEPGPADSAAAIGPSGVGQVLALVALTDLAFSLDSIGAAVAMTDNPALVVSAGALGLLMLRFLALGVIAWIERFENLANAAYVSVLSVGLRLSAQALAPALAPSDGVMIAIVLVLFVWGFCPRRRDQEPVSRVGDQATADPIASRPGIGA